MNSWGEYFDRECEVAVRAFAEGEQLELPNEFPSLIKSAVYMLRERLRVDLSSQGVEGLVNATIAESKDHAEPSLKGKEELENTGILNLSDHHLFPLFAVTACRLVNRLKKSQERFQQRHTEAQWELEDRFPKLLADNVRSELAELQENLVDDERLVFDFYLQVVLGISLNERFSTDPSEPNHGPDPRVSSWNATAVARVLGGHPPDRKPPPHEVTKASQAMRRVVRKLEVTFLAYLPGDALARIPGIGATEVSLLMDCGINSLADLVELAPARRDDLLARLGLNEPTQLDDWIASARTIMGEV